MSVEILTCGQQPEPEKEDCLSGSPDSDLLLSIVRMGSLQLEAQGRCEDLQDEEVISSLPAEACVEQVLSLCQTAAPSSPSAPLSRHWTPARCAGRDPARDIVVFQWNILSQALGTGLDNFQSATACLDWERRRWRVVEEIVRQEADIICLQEVDHFRLLERILASLGYRGSFVAKPDSPCLYVANNNGPDGCAIFYREDKFHCDRVEVSPNISHDKLGESNSNVVRAECCQCGESPVTRWGWPSASVTRPPGGGCSAPRLTSRPGLGG